jgi:hypothetical protein
MTKDKARKTAVRQRMAETGEPYSVARQATGAVDGEVPEPAFAGPDPGALGSAESRPHGLSPEEQYAREAAAAGRAPEQVEAEMAVFRLQERADQAQESARRARDQASEAEAAIDAADERADLARETADEADDWADAAELSRAWERIEQDAEQARQRAEAALAAADAAAEQADLAQEAADRAAEIAEEWQDWQDGTVLRDGPYFAGGPGRVSRPAPGGAPFAERWSRPPMPPMPPMPPRPPAPPRPFR